LGSHSSCDDSADVFVSSSNSTDCSLSSDDM
jgi:hypothetical protein